MSKERMLMRNLEAIAKGSTSPEHVIMQKLYVEESIYAPDFGTLNNGILSTLGIVRQIESEVKLQNGWRADHVETVEKLADEKAYSQTRAIEVLTGFSHTFWCYSDRSGRKYAEAFIEYLRERDLIAEGVRKNMYTQLRIKEIGKNNEPKKKFIHFWLKDPLDNTRKMDYREFSLDVDNPSEIERKYNLWAEQTDMLGFFVLNDFSLRYLFEFKSLRDKLAEGGKEFKMDMLATIPYDYLDQIKLDCAKASLFEKSVIKRPESLKGRPLIQKWSPKELGFFA